MALTEKHRNEIYRTLAPQWGEEVTQAFLSQFPAGEGEEPATRDFVRAELAELRGDLRAEMAELRGDLRAEMNQLGSRLAGVVIAVAGVMIGALGIASTVIIALS